MVISQFSEENLADALSNNYTTPEIILLKYHFRFLNNYLGCNGLGAHTILIEEEYISKDFLQDYASYYAFCFEKYPKFCKRVHFFKNDFDEAYFNSVILKSDSDPDFWNNYLGFIVVKPIPVTVIGLTVLKTYESNDFRKFWGIRDYKIHLFGHELTVKSVAFQEQDSVLAACATTAIWTMLNKASVDFHTVLKSPSQITKDADNVSPDGSRLFPNKGLNLLQICQAIFNSGLVSEVKQPDYSILDANNKLILKVISTHYLKKILNAYSPIGIPIILVIMVPTGGIHGLHAIAVSGFKQKMPSLIPPSNEVSWHSENIDKFYAHDDQWGPFARINFLNDYEIETPWTLAHVDKTPTLVTNIVVPIYPKIRISYEDIEIIVLGLDAILTSFFNNQIISDLVWDIKIDYSECFKSNLKNTVLSDEEKLKIIKQSMPKYIWIASCYITEYNVFQFTFDATDMSNGMIAESVITYFPDIKPTLKDFLINNEDIMRPLFRHKEGANYYNFLKEQLS